MFTFVCSHVVLISMWSLSRREEGVVLAYAETFFSPLDSVGLGAAMGRVGVCASFRQSVYRSKLSLYICRDDQVLATQCLDNQDSS